jgi:hypothetical protein
MCHGIFAAILTQLDRHVCWSGEWPGDAGHLSYYFPRWSNESVIANAVADVVAAADVVVAPVQLYVVENPFASALVPVDQFVHLAQERQVHNRQQRSTVRQPPGIP